MNIIINKNGSLIFVRVVACATLMLIAALLLAGCGRQESSGKLKVAATIIPLADFCRNVGGDLVEVRALIPAQAGCGHTFEPTPRDVEFLADSKVFVSNGLGLESWAADVLLKAGNSNVVSVVTSSAIPERLLLPTQDKDELVHAKPGDIIYDPHVWLDPTLAAYQVEAISDGLGKADPAHREQYERNAAAYLERLRAFDSQAKGMLAAAGGGAFVATHPTWGYFARHYGLVQAGSVEELPGREPSIAQINALVTRMKELKVKAALAEPQISPKALQVIAQDAGRGVRVVTVDPVGNPDEPAVSDYLKMMKHDADVIREALR